MPTGPRHAGLIALRRRGVWLGALIEGPSGIGKSDLSLRALGDGFRLVADDRVIVFRSGGRLFGRCPGPLAGLIEVRGVGVLPHSALPFAAIVLIVRCRGESPPDRHPKSEHETILGLSIPCIDLSPREASATAKLKLAVEHLGDHRQQGYQARPWICRGG